MSLRISSFCSSVRVLQRWNMAYCSRVRERGVEPSEKNSATVMSKALQMASRVGMEG